MDAKLTVRATGGTAWGNVWYDSAIRGGEGLPFALKSLTVGTVNVVGGNGSFWATQATSGTPTTAPTWYAVRATKGTSAVNLQAAYHIVGTWEQHSVSQEAASKGWTVKRRPDGYAECVRQVAFKSPIATAYGSLYRSSDYMASTAYPVTFRDVPMVTIGCYSDTTIMSASDGGTKTAAPNVYAVYSSKISRENDIVICVKAEGYTA